ncbi:hypothetical protein ACLKMY_01795 [Paraburkholderia mimosarum]|uniref:hypothetical protein n=1 Tax=Paraburkholderia mimosarum TaxID=312026 RepID=UPI00041E338F
MSDNPTLVATGPILKRQEVLPRSDEELKQAASGLEVQSLTGGLVSQLPNAWMCAVLLPARTGSGTGCHGNNGSIDAPSTVLPRFEYSASGARHANKATSQ